MISAVNIVPMINKLGMKKEKLGGVWTNLLGIKERIRINYEFLHKHIKYIYKDCGLFLKSRGTHFVKKDKRKILKIKKK